MYAIIRESGRQFKVEVGSEFQIDYREGLKKDDEIVFDDVLACRTDEKLLIGQPTLNVKVMAKVYDAEVKGPKLNVQRFTRRATYRKRNSHRQKYITVKVTAIDVAE